MNYLARQTAAAAILAGALASCATPGALAPPPGEAPPAGRTAPPVAAPQAGNTSPVVQTPEFVAVIVQPGDTLASLAATWLNDPARAWEIAEYNDIAAADPGQIGRASCRERVGYYV